MNVVSVAALAALFAAPAWAQDASYRSAFDHYQPFKDADLAPWKGANDTVRQVGGWRAYAREAAQGTSASTSASSPAGAAPAEVGSSEPGSPASTPGAAPHKH